MNPTDGSDIAGEAPDDDPARIVPLIADLGNRRLVRDWLEESTAYEPVAPDEAVPDAAFDLCILDLDSLREHEATLEARKEEASPELLPSLLILPENEAERFHEEATELADSVMLASVDDVISLPVRKPELRWRIEALLRLREQTREAVGSKRSAKRFKRAVEAAGHAIYVTDEEGRIKYANPAFEETTGYAIADVIGKRPGILSSGEMSDAYYERLWKTIETGEIWREEIVNARADGTTYVAEQTIAPIPGTDDAFDGFVAIQTDVTERRELEAELLEYRQVVESSPELLAAIDTERRFRFANDAYRDYHEIPDGSLRGSPVGAVLEEDVLAEIEPHLVTALSGEPVTFSTIRAHPERGNVVLEALYIPLRDDDDSVEGVAVSMRDVTAEREEARRLATLVGNLPGIVYRCRNEVGWPMEFVGGRCVEITGYEASALENDEVSWGNDVIDPAERERVNREVQQALDVGESFVLTYPIVTATGDRRWVEEHGREVTPFSHDEPMLEGFIMDVTARVERERQLEIIDRVLRHNVRNDLNVVQAAAELIETEGGDHVREYANQILETSTDLVETMEKERDITKILVDEPIVTEIDLAELVQSVVDSFGTASTTATIDLEMPERAPVSATEQVGIAIEELLRNALDHNDADEPNVEVSIAVTAAAVELRIADNGPGIPEMELNLLTEAEERTPLYHGEGLGLWLVKLIVRRSGGTVTYAANEPRGSVITVRLPGGNRSGRHLPES